MSGLMGGGRSQRGFEAGLEFDGYRHNRHLKRQQSDGGLVLAQVAMAGTAASQQVRFQDLPFLSVEGADRVQRDHVFEGFM